MNKFKYGISVLLIITVLVLSGCRSANMPDNTATTTVSTSATISMTETETQIETPTISQDAYNFTIVRHWSDADIEKAIRLGSPFIHNEKDPYYDVTRINIDYLSTFPDILEDGHPVYADHIVLNNNRPMFSIDFIEALADDNADYEFYSDLDNYGRCGTAYAVVCNSIMPTKKRGKIGSVKPSGWQTSKYDKDIISDMYLYNRCHLIGYQLAGENANPNNLITGTRFMNVVGMLPFENMVDDYIEANPNNHVLMQVTPVFGKTDLVAYGVVMSAISCEDKGAGVSYCVFCPNVQPKIMINYENGDNELAPANDWYTGKVPSFIHDDDDNNVSDASSETQIIPSSAAYIVNENTKKFHSPDCPSAKKISEKNKRETNETFEQLIANGYDPCNDCLK